MERRNRWTPREGLNQGASLKDVFRPDNVMYINWSQWPRWFHTNFGIGNDLGMWWPSRRGPHSVWVLCHRCGVPFEVPSGLAMFAVGQSDDGSQWDTETVAWTGGPCTHCRGEGVIATGTPMLTTLVDNQGRSVVGASRWIADQTYGVLTAVASDLEEGAVSVDEAARRLRAEGGYMHRLGEWLEVRPVTTAAASAILTAIISVLGPQVSARPANDGADDEKIAEIIDTVLDHYDKTHPPPTPPDGSPPASPKRRIRPPGPE